MSKCRAGEADSFCVARLHKLGATDFRSERVRTTDAQTPAISIRGLTKQYGSITALNKLNLDVVPGEVLGFLGLNGAGKTTAIRLLLDLLRPTSGKAFIFGHDCWTEGLAARARVGYLPGELGLYPDLTGFEVLDFLAGISRQAVDKRRRQELFDRLELPHSDLRRKLRQYSTGMKRKLGLIQALQADPPLLILDEPTEGLDPLMQESFYQLLAELKRRGRTVFMSSHVLPEVARVCDRVVLLRKGELALLATVEEIRKLAARRVLVFFSENVKLEPVFPASVHIVELKPQEWIITVEGLLGPHLGMLATLPVKDLVIQEPRLENEL